MTLSQAYTDNIDLAPDPETEDAFVTQLTPSFTYRREAAGSQIAWDGSSDIVYQSDGDDEGFQVIPRTAGFGNFELSDELLFLDVEGSVSQELLNSQQADTESNRETTIAGTVSPYMVNRLGSYANSELRYRYSQVY
ncbi:MAG: hypothetical protein R3245_10695, partial [Kiloniellales bacterium]|nr:hypothetical protein [Kiloniellales bacterium]